MCLNRSQKIGVAIIPIIVGIANTQVRYGSLIYSEKARPSAYAIAVENRLIAETSPRIFAGDLE